jgi:hypothetical protein
MIKSLSGSPGSNFFWICRFVTSRNCKLRSFQASQLKAAAPKTKTTLLPVSPISNCDSGFHSWDSAHWVEGNLPELHAGDPQFADSNRLSIMVSIPNFRLMFVAKYWKLLSLSVVRWLIAVIRKTCQVSMWIVIVVTVVWSRISLCSPGWPETCHLPLLVSKVLGLQACATTTHNTNFLSLCVRVCVYVCVCVCVCVFWRSGPCTCLASALPLSS